MTTEREALQQALVALELSQPARCGQSDAMYEQERQAHRAAIDAIREALAEKCVCGEPNTPGTHRTDGPCLAEQPAQQQEPVAWMHTNAVGHTYFRKHAQGTTFNPIPLYTSPPSQSEAQGLSQRKPLTRKEVLAIIDKHPAEKKTLLPMFYRDQVFDIARAIEAAHGIKEQP